MSKQKVNSTERTTFRWTPAEKRAAQKAAKAAQLELAEYIRRRVLGSGVQLRLKVAK